MRFTHHLGIFDSLLDGRFAAGRSVLWNGLAPWSTGDGKVTLLSESRARELAKIARDGGRKFHSGDPVAAGSVLILDFEHPDIDQIEPARLYDIVLAAKDESPGTMVGVYGYHLSRLGLNLDHWAAPTRETVSRFAESIEERRCVLDASDFINGDLYLLGSKWITRDLDGYGNAMFTLREFFPDKPFVPFVWGAFNTRWNPPGTLLNKTTLYRYVKLLRETCDGVIVWGQASDNAGLIHLLGQQRHTLLPADRKATWASEFVGSGFKGIGNCETSTFTVRQ